jgi:hypothetical protein
LTANDETNKASIKLLSSILDVTEGCEDVLRKKDSAESGVLIFSSFFSCCDNAVKALEKCIDSSALTTFPNKMQSRTVNNDIVFESLRIAKITIHKLLRDGLTLYNETGFAGNRCLVYSYKPLDAVYFCCHVK